MINPELVKENNINIFKCIQNPGEFVITFCGSYHAGFNMGFNCAEAVNFATKNWIDNGINAKVCKCQKDSVQIGMDDFIKTLLEKNIIKKKEYDIYLSKINDIKIKKKFLNTKNNFTTECKDNNTNDEKGNEIEAIKKKKKSNKGKIK